ncbi:MAG TPA: phosphoribosylaminoimidazolesuccinocarboxamide synthase [Bacteroidia bacterium]|jgi:phosphoribosylaminoimidazole-succinocarboxamide synthase|nr:phosphoribosylaminoimidazolesuccinocarboxamide synthase [Bacteroidia bacterium]HQF28158.1 phosphoribosylaminoimidazolesuccinocarboxamide synthase [Bacteroidia bacterium]HQK97881.1 phosphoribosylaminoimidazolesuccinocarboxamide synthase [Bacteroidia bacterium]
MSTLVNDANCISKTDFKFPGLTSVYHGKVRDVYTIENKLMLMVVSDRVSAFDFVMPRPIPFKGQVLNQLAAFFLNATRDICPNWVIEVPDPNVTIGILCQPFRVEMVIRGYLTGHAWREYKQGKRVLCGVTMPEGLKENDPFPEPIITPTTKSDHGHDQDISREEIIKQGIVAESDYIQLENYTRALYKKGAEMAKDKSLILVDTKYEFGKANDKIFLIDEIHTPDSSRYFYLDGYEERQAKGEAQRQLSKEFLRQWLIENNFQGLEGQTIPTFPDSFVMEVSNRYIELFEKISGQKFVKDESEDKFARIAANVEEALPKLLSGI